MNPVKKRHHRVPEFYLRHFATIKPEEEIWTYDLDAGTARPSTADATGYEAHLYSVTLPDGTRFTDIEDRIADIEGRAAPTHAKLIRGGALTTQEWSDYANFMSVMFLRTDAFRQQYAEAMVGGLQVLNYATASNDQAFKHAIERYQRDTGRQLTERDIKLLRNGMLNPQDFHLSVDKEWTLRALQMHEKLVPIFANMHWSVLHIAPPRFLITSDNPLVYGVPAPDRHPIYGGGLLDKKVEVTLPLSSQRCLLATWNKGTPRRVEIDREAVKLLNRLRAVHAMRYLFAPIKDEGIRSLGSKYKDVKPGMKISGFGPEEFSPVTLHRGGFKD